jgi:hypothetical protein
MRYVRAVVLIGRRLTDSRCSAALPNEAGVVPLKRRIDVARGDAGGASGRTATRCYVCQPAQV